MNATAVKGLFQDALYQVLDNRVFRVLLVLTLLPILASFLVGLNEDGFSLVFGLWEPAYPEWITLLGDDPRSVMLEFVLEVVVNSIVGSMGITVCVGATAFFVPRMLEKGAADLVFVKPIPRWALYLSRYVTGLVFVALLGLFLTVGMYLGVLVASGLSYPGILWSSLTLVYLFALIHGVTMLIGLLTKSTPAAMILGILFFFGNGCVHGGWQFVDQVRSEDSPQAALLGAARESADPGDEPGTWDSILTAGGRLLDGLHYVLPKTSDAPLVVLHSQEALFPSGRLEARSGFIEGLGRQEHRTRSEREERPPADPDTWFESQFGYDAEAWRYSAWFSLLSSLAFTVVVLGLGVWRLARMDF